MTPFFEKSAGVIPFRLQGDRTPTYLLIHSATVRNTQARWEFPKGGIEAGERSREAAAREFEEETGIVSWAFREGFERSVSYTYMRSGRKHFKTVVYFAAEVFDASTMLRSSEHSEDPFGRWCHWGSFEQTTRLLCHAQIRHLFAEADAWLCGGDVVREPTLDRPEDQAARHSMGPSHAPESRPGVTALHRTAGWSCGPVVRHQVSVPPDDTNRGDRCGLLSSPSSDT